MERIGKVALTHKWSGTDFGTESLPHFEDLKTKTSIDPRMIYSTLVAQRLTIWDAVVNLGPYCFRLLDMTDTEASEMKRFTDGSPERFIPKHRYITDEKSNGKPISKRLVTRAYKHLSPKSDRACTGKMVVKGAIISLVRTLDAVLEHSGDNDMGSDFDRPGERHRVIADWLNWALERGYKIKGDYDQEQVRQMLKIKNKYAGRFSTPLIAF